VDDFDGFVREVEPRLRRALIAARGPQDGRDATAEALAYAWENWATVQQMGNPAGYLFRVGCSKTRRRKVARPDAAPVVVLPEVEPGLERALRDLSEQQRVAVFLVHGCDWTHAEVAEVLEIAPSTVSTHVQRGLARLRELMEVSA
jgi:DNA-directed RNA polymerase specialized sigma24 family protein